MAEPKLRLKDQGDRGPSGVEAACRQVQAENTIPHVENEIHFQWNGELQLPPS
jgi:hypothetical protein